MKFSLFLIVLIFSFFRSEISFSLGLNSKAGNTTIYGYGFGIDAKVLESNDSGLISKVNIPISDLIEVTVDNPWGRIEILPSNSTQIEITLSSSYKRDLYLSLHRHDFELLVDQDINKIRISPLITKLSGSDFKNKERPLHTFNYDFLELPTDIQVRIPNHLLTKLNIFGKHSNVIVGNFKKSNSDNLIELNIETMESASCYKNDFAKNNINALLMIFVQKSTGILNLNSDIRNGRIEVISHFGSGSLTAAAIQLDYSSSDTLKAKYLITYPACTGRFESIRNSANIIMLNEIPDAAILGFNKNCH